MPLCFERTCGGEPQSNAFAKSKRNLTKINILTQKLFKVTKKIFFINYLRHKKKLNEYTFQASKFRKLYYKWNQSFLQNSLINR